MNIIKHNRVPKFIIIGAMKSATTSLYHYLASHFDMVPSSTKETDFFKTSVDFSKGLDWYKSLFPGNGKYAFECSPNYTKRHLFPGVPERMYSIIPKAKLIYVLRDPIERTISHYVHNVAHRTESRSFSQVIRDPNSNYVQTSKYFFQINAFLEYYPEKQIYLVQSEQLRNDPIRCMRDIYEFLNISFKFDPAVLAQRFHESSNKKRSSWFERKIIRTTNNRYLIAGIRKITSPLRKPIKKPVPSESDKEILRAAISTDIEELRRYFGRQFSGWSI